MAVECAVSPATVTAVLKLQTRNRRVEVALAALMVPPTPVDEAFGAEAPGSVRATVGQGSAA